MIPLGGDMGQINLTTAWFRFEHEDPAASALYATFRRGIEPHVAATVDEACRRDLADLREQSLVLPPPAAGEAAQTQPATTPEEPTAERLLKLDAPLVRAVELIETPARMEAILREAAASRSAELKARQAKTRAARAGAEKSSGGAQDAPGER